tara:strand:- start:170 stop:274 length:105 start_codon:yes stop_codon:yes gene_type:complete
MTGEEKQIVNNKLKFYHMFEVKAPGIENPKNEPK